MQLGTDEFSHLMVALPTVGKRFAVAVSGGADSLALCLLCAEWAVQHGKKLIALSVNHGLRAEAEGECQWVSQALSHYNVEHHILTGTSEAPKSDIQAAARELRYQLMQDFCIDHDISDLFLAHHQDDQAETFLLRLARGSGVDGLSAMKPVTQRGHLRLLRPLLTVPKASLVSYLEERNQSWIEDPSNENTAFERVKMRKAMGALAELGLTPHRLSQTAGTMQRVSGVMTRLSQDWLAQNFRLFEEAYGEFSHSALSQGEEEVILRCLSRIGMAISGEIYPPRFEKLQKLLGKLLAKQDATLMGCRWINQGEDILVCREVRLNEVSSNIYQIDNHHSKSAYYVRMLGQDGWAEIIKCDETLRQSPLVKPVLYSLISFWDDKGVLAVPHLDYVRENESFEVDLALIAKKRLFS
ncbi:putative tRNA(Ile)-lysidine synthase [Candidatus Terasakiella magnetica]|uniref:tRNA(Ile)-lysidine synthase n=1 Tax=Candidatus Terasakiella magnetica TaxID=1867952 RepID=A0A1C3RHR3_9PROT|nr:tRNA lysidine(34) synthetase TilS [Candidatus Terasakiella magnetica]SCA56805.1 putative tRNA(Ile)-lysidine synthase [Candidatus Terasakiella magnetica]